MSRELKFTLKQIKERGSKEEKELINTPYKGPYMSSTAYLVSLSEATAKAGPKVVKISKNIFTL